LSPDLIESSVSAVIILDDLSVCIVAEGRIGSELAVAEFIVSTLADVELDGPVSSGQLIAKHIAPRVTLRNSTRAPIVNFSLLQISVVWVVTSIQGNTRRSVATLRVGDRLRERNCLLSREVSDVIGLLLGSGCGGLLG
jgi:hypothetical protein